MMSAAEPRPAEPALDDKVNEAIDESFPASDPPATRAAVTSGAPDHDTDQPRSNTPVIALIAVAAVLVLLWAVFG
jgi:hypothetical protein